MDLVIVESPYSGKTRLNERYARACLRDCLIRGEAPLASHLLYTQPGVLLDADPSERALGIEAGLAWGAKAARTVVYVDLGVSNGMREGIARAAAEGRPVETRLLPDWSTKLASEPPPAAPEEAPTVLIEPTDDIPFGEPSSPPGAVLPGDETLPEAAAGRRRRG